jgi:hypothetical protein
MFPYIVAILIEYDTLWSYVNRALIFAKDRDEAIAQVDQYVIDFPFQNQKGYQILDCKPYVTAQYPQWIYDFSELVNSPKYN